MSSRAVITLLMLLAIGTMAYADQTPITFDTNSSRFLAPYETSQYVWQDLSFSPVGATTVTPNSSGFADINNLGTFTLDCDTGNYNSSGNDAFDLKIHFTAPTGLNGGQTTDWDADLSGKIKWWWLGTYGTISLFFDTPSQTFTYGPPGNPNGSGQFTLSLTGGEGQVTDTGSSYYGDYEYDLSCQFGCGESQTLTAQITNASFSPHDASVPEPTSIILLGTVLCGVAVSLRKRLA